MNMQQIFVIDSDPEITDTLMAKLEDVGLEGYAINSIEQAVDLIQTMTPDLILMDMAFAQTEGVSFMMRLKQVLSPFDALPPISVINGADDQFINAYAYDLGSVDVHCKTYDADSLRTLMDDYRPSDENELVF